MIPAIFANGAGGGDSESADNDTSDGELITAVELAVLNHRRQTILTYLAAHDGEVNLSSLALHLMADEDTTLSAMIEELHEHHLPALAAHDLLDYDRAGVVTLVIDPSHAEALVARVGDETG